MHVVVVEPDCVQQVGERPLLGGCQPRETEVLFGQQSVGAAKTAPSQRCQPNKRDSPVLVVGLHLDDTAIGHPGDNIGDTGLVDDEAADEVPDLAQGHGTAADEFDNREQVVVDP